MNADRRRFLREYAAVTRYERSEVMGREAISKLLLRFSVPAIIAMEASAGYNLFDAIWCGRLGAEALAALSVSGPLMTIYRAVGTGIGVGAASLIARHLGAGRREEADRVACNSIFLFFMVSGLMTVVCLVNLETLLRLFGADDSVLPFAESYMFIETIFMALDFFLVVLAELVRVQGSPGLASVGMVVASAVDLIWSPILVFGVDPFPAVGIAGAALGTVIGRATGVFVLLVYLGLGKSIYQFKHGYFMPDRKMVAGIYSIGISSTVRSSAFSVSQIIACRAAASFGVAPLAVLGVLYKVNTIVFGFYVGLSQGMLPLIGYNFGARKYERIGETVVKALLASFVWGALWWTVATLFSTQVMLLFNPDQDFLALGTLALSIFALNFFAGLDAPLSSFFQGIGKAIPSLVVASSRQLIFLIPCLLIMPSIYGLTGLWAAYPVAGTMSIMLSLAWTGITFNKLKIPFRMYSKISQL